LALPAWLALMEHCPAATMVKVVPLVPVVVQTAVVVDAKMTGVRPEVAVALRVDCALGLMYVTPGSVAQVMVCEAGLTVKDWLTEGAAAQRDPAVSEPVWVA